MEKTSSWKSSVTEENQPKEKKVIKTRPTIIRRIQVKKNEETPPKPPFLPILPKIPGPVNLQPFIIIQAIPPAQPKITKLTPLKSVEQIKNVQTKNSFPTGNNILIKVVENLETDKITKNPKTEKVQNAETEGKKETNLVEIHYKKTKNGKYTCDLCQATFEKKNYMHRHLKSKHSFHRPFKCSVCPKAFKYKCDLKSHRLIHEEVDSNLLHFCDKCDFRSKTRNNLKAHYIRKHTDDYKYSCDQCDKKFKMEWDLKFHMGTHGKLQHMCDICGKFYRSNYSLYKHRKVAHINDYKFQCSVCNKRLLTQENLDNHMKQHNKTYDCKICGKNFASKRYLSTHATTHSAIKPFNCHVCDKKFRTSHMRNTHLFTHTQEKPFICDLCGQNFKRRYYMIEHRKKHPDAHLSSPPIPLVKSSLPNLL